jgi:glycosyltransferase involved in cell wall biosynthesis
VSGRLANQTADSTARPLDSTADSRVVATVFVPYSPYADAAERFFDTVTSLRRAHPSLSIVVAAPEGVDLAIFGDLPVQLSQAPSLQRAVGEQSQGGLRHVLAVGDGVSFPPAALDRAIEAVESDVRIASVSFWSNAADIASYPHLQTPVSQPPVGHDAATLTRALRVTDPPLRPVPVLYGTGAAILLSGSGLSATGGIEGEPNNTVDGMFADYGLRARARGLVNLLDPSTYLMRSFDVAAPDAGRLSPYDENWLVHRHPWFRPFLRIDADERYSPLRVAHHRARAAIDGMRVLIDGSSLGPLETGTQVQTLSLVRALADRPEIRELTISLTGPVPDYATISLDHSKIRVVHAPLPEIGAFGPIDIVHRPFQPDRRLDIPLLRGEETRVVITIQDLIAFRTGSYHETPQTWLEYRNAVRWALSEADAVVAITDDVIEAITDEALPVERERLHRVPNGTDHLEGGAPERFPSALLDREFGAQRFALVLGTTYAHKHRDLAIRAVQDVRARGRSILGILAGAQVPVGSSRRTEALARKLDNSFLELPDVSSEERTWLIRHAAVLLYPSSAEGFGLVPFEAARLGTPTVAVDFGPLHEVQGTAPVSSRDWSPASLADGIERLLADPSVRDAQLAHALSAAGAYTWASTAEQLVKVYARTLAQPLRSI